MLSKYSHRKVNMESLQETGIIIFITDPSGANIYIDGDLQSVKTSTSIRVPTGNRTITFTKSGYVSYTQVVSGLKKDQTIKVSAILGQTANLTNSGIVICTTANITSCPITPLTCPTSINPLDYINLIAIINSTLQTTVTIRFTYTLNDIIHYDNTTVNLSTGNNIVYAWSTNRRYDVNTTITLIDVSLI